MKKVISTCFIFSLLFAVSAYAVLCCSLEASAALKILPQYSDGSSASMMHSHCDSCSPQNNSSPQKDSCCHKNSAINLMTEFKVAKSSLIALDSLVAAIGGTNTSINSPNNLSDYLVDHPPPPTVPLFLLNRVLRL